VKIQKKYGPDHRMEALADEKHGWGEGSGGQGRVDRIGNLIGSNGVSAHHRFGTISVGEGNGPNR
jgi:hypothetical protein